MIERKPEFLMSELRLGDILDDYCVKCRRMTNHAIVSIVDSSVAKVRCRSCYHDHDYLHEQIPPSKKDLKKAELLAAAAKAPEDGDSLAEEHTEEETHFDPEKSDTSAEVALSSSQADGKKVRGGVRKA